MNDETTRIAERYGITEKCSLLEHDLLGIYEVILVAGEIHKKQDNT